MSTRVEELISPYLQEILAKGKKYRLQQPMGTVLTSLKEGLRGYIDFKLKKQQQ